MPRTGNGTYVLPANSWNPAVSNSTIESSANNATMNDLAAALTQSLSKDGQTVPTAAIQLGNFKIINLADGTTSTDAMTFGQGAKLAGGNIFTGDQTINGSVSLSGDLSVSGTVIFTSGNISVGNLTVTSVASVASLNVTGASNLNILNVASIASLNVLTVSSTASVNMLTVASTAAVAVLSVGSSIVVGAASGGSKGAGTINAQNIYINGTAVSVAGKLVNRYYFEYATNAALFNDFSLNNTLPAGTEGNDIFGNMNVVTTSATQRVRFTMMGFGSGVTNGCIVANLMKGGTSIRTQGAHIYATNALIPVPLLWEGLIGSATTTTFNVRVGGVPSLGTVRMNGSNGGHYWDTAGVTSVTIDVIEP